MGVAVAVKHDLSAWHVGMLHRRSPPGFLSFTFHSGCALLRLKSESALLNLWLW